MSMNVQPMAPGPDPDVMIDINTTPLIDVMLVLIIMLIITIPIQLHAVNLHMPSGQPPPAQEPAVVRVDIGADGSVSWNGEALAGEPALEARLQQVAASADPPELHLRPHAQVAYRSVAMVLARAQRHGVTKLGVVGNERFAR